MKAALRVWTAKADPDLPNEYERTGNITDINTLRINRAELRRMLPWWRQMLIRFNHYSRGMGFRLNT